MVSFNSWLDSLVAVGYNEPKARSRIAHDVVLMAMEKSGLARNVTIKGGVVMSDITDDVRRATMDMDVDLIRYSLDDDKIDEFIGRLNCIEGVMIERTGEIVELQHRDYHGKYSYVNMGFGNGLEIDNRLYEQFKPYLLAEYDKKKEESDFKDDSPLFYYSSWEPALEKMLSHRKK